MLQRREFLSISGAVSLAVQAQPRDVYPAVLKAAEAEAEKLIARQQPGGGMLDANGLPLPVATAGLLSMLTAVYLAPQSRFRRSGELLQRMLRAAESLRRAQNADGTIDLPTTNFGSPPDTGFVLEPVCLTALLIRSSPELRPLEIALEPFIRRAAAALATGGVHTPNHRWVIVSALARCHKLYPNQQYVARIDQWLAEGIDIDAESQFTERSTGVYNWVTDGALFNAARMLDRPALLEPVRRNLEAMLYLARPGGEVVTDISRRQDRFQRATLRNYWRVYRWLAKHDGNGRFAATADVIERLHAPEMAGEMIYLLEMPELRQDDTPRAAPPDNYDRHSSLHQLAHIRRGEVDATILGGHSRFFSFRHGGAVVEAVRFASGFFGKGQFLGELGRQADGYRIDQSLAGDYMQPLDAADRRASGDWSAMPHSRRARSNVFRLHSFVRIKEREGGYDLAIEVEGTDRVPFAAEITLRPGGRLTGDGLAAIENARDAFLLRDGFATYEAGGRRIRFGPGVQRHSWTQVRGAEPRIDGLTVYITDFTPVKRTIQFRT